MSLKENETATLNGSDLAGPDSTKRECTSDDKLECELPKESEVCTYDNLALDLCSNVIYIKLLNVQKLPYPKAVFFVAGNEFCERFSYYGMRSKYKHVILFCGQYKLCKLRFANMGSLFSIRNRATVKWAEVGNLHS